MKSIKWFLSVLSMFLIFSCTTTSDTNKESIVVEETKEEVVEPAKVVEKKMVEKEIEEIIYFVTKEESFYGDGQIDTKTTYIYNDNFVLMNKIITNEQGEVLESSANKIVNNNISRTDNYGYGNILNTYTTFEYDSQNRVVKETMFDKENKIQSVNEYIYKDGLLTTWNTLGANGGVLAITEYVYDKNGNNTEINMKNSGNVLDGKIVKIYADNAIKSEEIRDSKGKIEKSVSYVYEGKMLKEKIFMDEKGNKKRSESYEYSDNKPVPTRINQLYKSGAIEAYSNFEYAEKVIKTKVMVEE